MSILEKLEKLAWYKVIFLVIIPILGVVGVAFTIYSIFTTQHKELSYEVGQIVPVTNLDAISDTRIKVYFDGDEVHNISIVSIKFINTGNLAIDNTDFKKPLLIKTNEPSTILATNSYQASNTELGIELQKKLSVKNPSIVSISDVFLNPGDYFYISLIISEYNNKPFELDYRIKDIIKLKNIKKDTVKTESPINYALVGLFGIGATISGNFLATMIMDRRIRKRRRLAKEKYEELVKQGKIKPRVPTQILPTPPIPSER